MTKHSAFERQKRAAETVRIGEIEHAWRGSLPAAVARAFDDQVRAAKARGPLPPPPDQAPGTIPNPPRPGREPKPPKVESGSRGRR